MGLMFYPRGGSAPVARYLSGALLESGWEIVLASGSLGSPGERTHAATFFEGLQVAAADYTPALKRFEHGEDQLAGPIPFHGSFDQRFRIFSYAWYGYQCRLSYQLRTHV